jgi:hypothetical protein
VEGLVPHLILGVVTHLRMSNDMIFLFEKTHINIVNVKFLLLYFEMLFGIKTIFSYHLCSPSSSGEGWMLSLLEDRLAWMPWPNGSPFGVKSKRLILGLICIVSLGLLSPRAISQLCCFLERFDSDNCIFIKDMWSAKIFTIKVKHEMLHFP